MLEVLLQIALFWSVLSLFSLAGFGALVLLSRRPRQGDDRGA